MDIAPHLNDENKSLVLQEALAAALEINEPSYRASILAALAPHLNDENKSLVLQEALPAARVIKDESDRASILAALAPHLNDENKSQALAAARKIKDEHYRANALASLVPYLNNELQIIALEEVLSLQNIDSLISSTMNTWKEIDFKGLKEHIILFIKFASKKNREDGVEIAGALTSTLVHFSGQEIVPELYRSIQDTARWWP
jgi:hypothetical protein